MMKIYSESNIELKRKISILMYLCVLILFVIIIAYVILNQNHNLFIISCLFLAIVVTFAIGIGLKIHITPYLSKMLLENVKTEIKDFEFAPNKGIPEKFFRDSEFVKEYTSYISYNFIAGKTNKDDFIFSEVFVKNKTSTSKNNESVVIFKGVFGIKDAVASSNIDMVIAPDVKNKFLNSISEDVKKAFGANKDIVRLENVEFERHFEVYSNDQIEARKIITMKFMENLMKLKKRFNKNVTLVYKNNRIYLFVENTFFINSLKLYINGVNEKMINETSEILNLLAETVSSI